MKYLSATGATEQFLQQIFTAHRALVDFLLLLCDGSSTAHVLHHNGSSLGDIFTRNVLRTHVVYVVLTYLLS